MSEPMDSRRKTYWPPARGYIAASSPYARAPKIVTTPETNQAIKSQKGEFTVRAMSADTMKMPDPIMDPETSIVASVRVIALTNSRDDGGVSAVVVVVVNALPLMPGFALCSPPGQRAEVTRERPILLGKRLENDLDFRGVALRGSVRMYARPEAH